MESRKWLNTLPSSNITLNNTQFTVLSFNVININNILLNINILYIAIS
jgi:hypothetical protein